MSADAGKIAVSAWRERADYVMPCPVCSFLDVEGVPDMIRTPLVVHRRRAGNFGLTGCSPACGLCHAGLVGATPEALAAAWHGRVAEFARECSGEALQKLIADPGLNRVSSVIYLWRKLPLGIARLARRGLVPDEVARVILSEGAV